MAILPCGFDNVLNPKTVDITLVFEDPSTGVTQPYVFSLKKLSYGEVNDIIRACMGKAKLTKDGITADIDFALLKEMLLTKVLVKAPFTVGSVEAIRALPPDVGDELFDRAFEINPFFGKGNLSITSTN